MASAGRFEFEKCVTGRCKQHAHPSLPSATGRLVALTVATFADGNGVIPAQYSPSLTTLADSTGLARSTVAAALTELEQSQWITRERPPIDLARSQKITTTYRLTSPTGGLVRDTDQSTSPGDGLASPAGGPELVRQADGASPAAGPNQYFQNKPAAAHAASPTRGPARNEQDDPMRNDPHAEQLARVAGLLDVTDPGRIVDAWTRHRPELRNPLAVLARMPDDEVVTQLRRYRPTPERPTCKVCEGDGWITDEAGEIIRKCDCRTAAS